MATYKDTKGTNIEAVSSDPSNPIVGQVWYNTTDNVLKGQRTNLAGSWSTSNNMNTARNYLASATNGSKSAALGFGGVPPNATAAV